MTQLDPSELAYHIRLADMKRVADQMEKQIAVTQAASSVWYGHLAAKYGLGPGDRIDESGAIIRAAPSAAPKKTAKRSR